ncbi:MAG TPA: hypothetical protein VFV00_17595 [Acidimicrobiales bacterium]|nr:hypothetical protein [Acidimicrobiales bacterium]
MDELLVDPVAVYHRGVDVCRRGLGMSLSDRLQQARTQQLIDSGVLPVDHVAEMAEPEPEPDFELDAQTEVDEAAETNTGLFAPVTIEVQPVGLHLVADVTVDLTDIPSTGADSDGRCPNCNGAGVVDMVDLVGHTVHYSCATCSTMWHVRKAVVPEGTVAS